MSAAELGSQDRLWSELWVSLASLLRSYCAVHGLNGKRQATVEMDNDRILAHCGEDWLDLRRTGPEIGWQRADGRAGRLELTEAGQLRSAAGEEEMDMAAERWARELMQ